MQPRPLMLLLSKDGGSLAGKSARFVDQRLKKKTGDRTMFFACLCSTSSTGRSTFIGRLRKQKHCSHYNSNTRLASTSQADGHSGSDTTKNEKGQCEREIYNEDSYSGRAAATIIRGPGLLVATGVHRPYPSLFHLPGLRSLPFWTALRHSVSKEKKNTTDAAKLSLSTDDNIQKENFNQNGLRTIVAYGDDKVSSLVRHVESHSTSIRDEYLLSTGGNNVLKSDYDLSSNNANIAAGGLEHSSNDGSGRSLHTGQWDWHSYIQGGITNPDFAKTFPLTAKMLDDISDDLFLGNPFSFAFFSVLGGKAAIKAHTGPMNLRLRFHLPLVVPQNSCVDDCGIRVGNQQTQWTTGKALVLDDSYEHEVWNKTSECRVLLLFDVWHPDIQKEERQRITEMFLYAKEQGWVGNGEASANLG